MVKQKKGRKLPTLFRQREINEEKNVNFENSDYHYLKTIIILQMRNQYHNTRSEINNFNKLQFSYSNVSDLKPYWKEMLSKQPIYQNIIGYPINSRLPLTLTHSKLSQGGLHDRVFDRAENQFYIFWVCLSEESMQGDKG